MTGYFSGTVDFDPAAAHADNTDIRTSSGDRDIFVSKFAADGSFLWANQMAGAGTGSTGIGRSLALDGSGNVYIDGFFGGQIAFGSTNLTSTGSRNGFAAKLDASGNVQWATRWSDAASSYPWTHSPAVDGTGNVLTVNFGATVLANGTSTNYAVVRKFSPGGTTLWVDKIGPGIGNTDDLEITADTAGNAYLCGQFAGTVNFDPHGNHTIKGGSAEGNGFVEKLNTAGNIVWVSPFLGQSASSRVWCSALALDGSGNVVVGGSYAGLVDFNPANGSVSLLPSANAGFVTKLTSSGSLVWAKQVGNTNFAGVQAVALDASGNVYVTGMLQGSTVFGGQTTLTSNGSTDVFVAKLDSSGNFGWAVSFGGTGLDSATGIAVDTTGNIYLAGYYANTVNFNTDPLGPPDYLTSAGLGDIFLVKLK